MKLSRNICVVGAGYWGKNHIRTLSELGALGGIVDSNEKTLNDLKVKYPSIPIFQTLTAAIKARIFSGYIVSTPAKTHFEVAMNIINSDCHVLVEKPALLDIFKSSR